MGELEVGNGNGGARALRALDEEEEVEEVLRRERAALRTEPRDERRPFVEPAERDREAGARAGHEIPRDAEPAHDLERVRRRRGARSRSRPRSVEQKRPASRSAPGQSSSG